MDPDDQVAEGTEIGKPLFNLIYSAFPTGSHDRFLDSFVRSHLGVEVKLDDFSLYLVMAYDLEPLFLETTIEFSSFL